MCVVILETPAKEYIKNIFSGIGILCLSLDVNFEKARILI
jgi:hypothetical protein